MNKGGYVYILASERNGTLYIGVTNNLEKRIYQHQNDLVKGFTQKYQVHRLVWFEERSDIEAAIVKEKVLKKWNRTWKVELIEKHNPNWKDQAEELFDWIPNQVGNDVLQSSSSGVTRGSSPGGNND